MARELTKKERLAIPPLFHRNLREQETRLALRADHEAVPAHLDRLRGDRFHWGQGTDLEPEIRQFVRFDRRKPWILRPGGNRHPNDRLHQGAPHRDLTDTPTQRTAASVSQRHEGSARLQ